jgi:phosphoribosylpyrophosphate synthetase
MCESVYLPRVGKESFMLNLGTRLVMATRSSQHLLEELRGTEWPGFEIGSFKRKRFPDGEFGMSLTTPVEGRDIILIASLETWEDVGELAELAWGVKNHGGLRLTVIVPWFGCQTMDRSKRPDLREVVTAQVRANVLSTLPQPPLGTTFVVLDAHIETINGFFGQDVVAKHLYCQPAVLEAIREFTGEQDFVLNTGDGGRLQWVESYSRALGVDMGVVLSSRDPSDPSKKRLVAAMTALVAGRHVVTYDDMGRTLGTAQQAGRANEAAGAREQTLVLTHPDFCGYGTPECALTRLKREGPFARIVCLNTHSRIVEIAKDPAFAGFLHVRSCVPVIRGYLDGKFLAA